MYNEDDDTPPIVNDTLLGLDGNIFVCSFFAVEPSLNLVALVSVLISSKEKGFELAKVKSP